MIGDESVHRGVLQERINKIGGIMRTANITRHQARVAYNSIYTPMMTYILLACSSKETELDNL
jgi:hypothetical protein